MPLQESEGHRLHLKALVRQERNHAYRRHDYLSHKWQTKSRDQSQWQSSSSSSLAVVVGIKDDDHSPSPDEKKKMKNFIMAQPPPPQRHSPSSVGNMTIPEDDDDDHFDAPASSDNNMMCIRWREKIIEWKYQVVDRFDLSREIVSISTFYLDQYLAMHSVDDELFQLVAMSSIYLAIKIHSPKKVTMRSIASTGNGLITVKHIEAMELSIIKTLNWHLLPPTCVSFIENFYPLLSSASPTTTTSSNHYHHHPSNSFSDVRMVESLELSRFLAELSVCAYPFVSVKQSSIAIAAILYSMEYFGLPEQVRMAFLSSAADASLDVNTPEVEACGKLLRRVYTLAMPPDTPFMA